MYPCGLGPELAQRERGRWWHPFGLGVNRYSVGIEMTGVRAPFLWCDAREVDISSPVHRLPDAQTSSPGDVQLVGASRAPGDQH